MANESLILTVLLILKLLLYTLGTHELFYRTPSEISVLCLTRCQYDKHDCYSKCSEESHTMTASRLDNFNDPNFVRKIPNLITKHFKKLRGSSSIILCNEICRKMCPARSKKCLPTCYKGCNMKQEYADNARRGYPESWTLDLYAPWKYVVNNNRNEQWLMCENKCSNKCRGHERCNFICLERLCADINKNMVSVFEDQTSEEDNSLSSETYHPNLRSKPDGIEKPSQQNHQPPKEQWQMCENKCSNKCRGHERCNFICRERLCANINKNIVSVFEDQTPEEDNSLSSKTYHANLKSKPDETEKPSQQNHQPPKECEIKCSYKCRGNERCKFICLQQRCADAQINVDFFLEPTKSVGENPVSNETSHPYLRSKPEEIDKNYQPPKEEKCLVKCFAEMGDSVEPFEWTKDCTKKCKLPTERRRNTCEEDEEDVCDSKAQSSTEIATSEDSCVVQCVIKKNSNDIKTALKNCIKKCKDINSKRRTRRAISIEGTERDNVHLLHVDHQVQKCFQTCLDGKINPNDFVDEVENCAAKCKPTPEVSEKNENTREVDTTSYRKKRSIDNQLANFSPRITLEENNCVRTCVPEIIIPFKLLRAISDCVSKCKNADPDRNARRISLMDTDLENIHQPLSDKLEQNCLKTCLHEKLNKPRYILDDANECVAKCEYSKLLRTTKTKYEYETNTQEQQYSFEKPLQRKPNGRQQGSNNCIYNCVLQEDVSNDPIEAQRVCKLRCRNKSALRQRITKKRYSPIPPINPTTNSKQAHFAERIDQEGPIPNYDCVDQCLNNQVMYDRMYHTKLMQNKTWIQLFCNAKCEYVDNKPNKRNGIESHYSHNKDMGTSLISFELQDSECYRKCLEEVNLFFDTMDTLDDCNLRCRSKFTSNANEIEDIVVPLIA